MKSRCVLASSRAELRSSFKDLAGFLKLKRMPRKSRLTHSRPGRTSCPSASSLSSTKPWIVDPLRHKTSVTRMMCSLSCVMSAGDSIVFLPNGAVRGALRFQRFGVFWLVPSNIPKHKRWTSHKHRCMSHRRCVFHWCDMSRNQSRTMGSTWPCCCWARLQRVLRLWWTERPGRPGWHEEVLTWATSSCVSGQSMVSPGRHQAGCGSSWWWKTCFWRARSHTIAAASWASGGPPPLYWWPTQTNRQGNGGPLGPHVTSEEEYRSTDENEQWKNTWEPLVWEWKSFRKKRQSIFNSLPERCAHRSG